MYYIGARTALHVEDQSTKYHNQSNAIYDIENIESLNVAIAGAIAMYSFSNK